MKRGLNGVGTGLENPWKSRNWFRSLYRAEVHRAGSRFSEFFSPLSAKSSTDPLYNQQSLHMLMWWRFRFIEGKSIASSSVAPDPRLAFDFLDVSSSISLLSLLSHPSIRHLPPPYIFFVQITWLFDDRIFCPDRVFIKCVEESFSFFALDLSSYCPTVYTGDIRTHVRLFL